MLGFNSGLKSVVLIKRPFSYSKCIALLRRPQIGLGNIVFNFVYGTTQIPQTGTNMQGAPYGLFQTQEGDETMVIRSEGSRKHGYRMVKYRVVNGGNAGPILVNVGNPKIGEDNKERRGEVCPTCGKGILLIDMDCVREQSCCAPWRSIT